MNLTGTATRITYCQQCFKTVVYEKHTMKRVYDQKRFPIECHCQDSDSRWRWARVDQRLRALWYRPARYPTRRNDKEKKVKRR